MKIGIFSVTDDHVRAVLQGVAVVCVSVALSVGVCRALAPRPVVSVQMAALTEAFVHRVAASQATPAQKRAQIGRFAARLDGVLQRLAQAHGWTVVSGSSVLAGGHDITQAVARQLAQGGHRDF